ncbi:MAG: NTP transferase domain-containing protein [Candidatus Eisenbacteria bacterium]|nr:NTP transferase domain-containing protein [Candidatus Eisenbacteria bacterium]
MTSLAVVVLAAGKGTRMPADVPKVLRPVAGVPLLLHVLQSVRALSPERIVMVVGHRGDEVAAAVAGSAGAAGASASGRAGSGAAESGSEITIVRQETQRGTGDAVLCAEGALRDFAGTVLVVYGDVPLLRWETLAELCELHALERNAASVLSATLEEPRGYGRIVRNSEGRCIGIVEQRDLTFEQETIGEINSGIIAFESQMLFPALHRIRPDNAASEYYLTDVIGILCAAGERVGTYHLRDANEILGVNTLEQLGEVERLHACRARRRESECELCRAAASANGGQGSGGQAASGQASDQGVDGGLSPERLLLGSGERTCLMVASHPFNNGHLLVFPRRHITSFPSLTHAELTEIAGWVRTAERLLRKAYRMDALNMGANSGSGGHLAFHLIPRWGGDLNFLPLLAGLKLVPESPRGTWERLSRAME